MQFLALFSIKYNSIIGVKICYRLIAHYNVSDSVYDLVEGRYFTDAATLSESKKQAEACLKVPTAKHDPLTWEIDFPDTPEKFIPFLGIQTLRLRL